MSAPRKIDISRPCCGPEEIAALAEPLSTGWLTQGPKVAEFEKAFARRHQVKRALACTSCTTALHLILEALGVGPGDEVLVPSFTWVASANAVLYCGATPVLCDVDPSTYNLDPAEVARKLNAKTKAVMAVHLFGLCADIDAIRAAAPGIHVVEDAACAVGSSYRDRSAGALGLAGAFSFHPRKVVTTGEGGMVTTDDEKLAETVNSLRNHGASLAEEDRHRSPRPYRLAEYGRLGYNYRMTDLQGAVGLVQLAKLDRFLEERRRWAEFYRRELAGLGWLRLPVTPKGYGPSWQSFVARVEKDAPLSRDDLMEGLHQRGVATRPGTHAVHMLGYYRERFGFHPDDLPVSRDCERFTLSLPMHNQMSPEDFSYVVEQLQSLSR